jgi:hypothetical protein
MRKEVKRSSEKLHICNSRGCFGCNNSSEREKERKKES